MLFAFCAVSVVLAIGVFVGRVTKPVPRGLRGRTVVQVEDLPIHTRFVVVRGIEGAPDNFWIRHEDDKDEVLIVQMEFWNRPVNFTMGDVFETAKMSDRTHLVHLHKNRTEYKALVGQGATVR